VGCLRIYISKPRYGNRGGIYGVHLGGVDGDPIISSTIEPLCDAARVLHARGHRGRLEMWDATTSYPRMAGDIVKLSRLTVAEGDRQSPVFRRYVERPKDGDFVPGSPTYRQQAIRRPRADMKAANGIPYTRAA